MERYNFNNQEPTARERWTAFYELYRITSKQQSDAHGALAIALDNPEYRKFWDLVSQADTIEMIKIFRKRDPEIYRSMRERSKKQPKIRFPDNEPKYPPQSDAILKLIVNEYRKSIVHKTYTTFRKTSEYELTFTQFLNELRDIADKFRDILDKHNVYHEDLGDNDILKAMHPVLRDQQSKGA